MPRYFLIVSDRGQVIQDDEGIDCADLHEARLQAYSAIGELVRDGAWEINSNSARSVTISDTQGRAIEEIALWQARERLG